MLPPVGDARRPPGLQHEQGDQGEKEDTPDSLPVYSPMQQARLGVDERGIYTGRMEAGPDYRGGRLGTGGAGGGTEARLDHTGYTMGTYTDTGNTAGAGLQVDFASSDLPESAKRARPLEPPPAVGGSPTSMPEAASISISLFTRYMDQATAVMDREGFKLALLEGFSYSLSTQPFTPSLVESIEEALHKGGRLHKGLPTHGGPAGGLLGRAFDYFDKESKGALTQHEFLKGMARASTGNFRERCEFLFFVSDANGDGLLGETEVDAFFMHFTHFFYTLTRNVLSLDLEALSPGESPTLVDKLLSQCITRLDAAENGAVESAREELFRHVDTNHDRFLSLDEWLEAREHLPGMYNKLASLMSGVSKGGCLMYRDAASPQANVDLMWGEEGNQTLTDIDTRERKESLPSSCALRMMP